VLLLLFLYVVGCYSCYIACVLVKYYLHNHHLISGALVVYCVAIDLPLPSTHHHHPPICCWCCCYSIALLILILFCFMCHGEVLPLANTLCRLWNPFAIENKKYMYISIFFKSLFCFMFFHFFISIFFQKLFICLITILLFFLQEFSKKFNVNKNIFIFYLHMFANIFMDLKK